jgi:hypothetical protein
MAVWANSIHIADDIFSTQFTGYISVNVKRFCIATTLYHTLGKVERVFQQIKALSGTVTVRVFRIRHPSACRVAASSGTVFRRSLFCFV